jgi:hypothetical protein
MAVNMLGVAIAMANVDIHYVNYDLMIKQFSKIKKQRRKEQYEVANLENGKTNETDDVSSEDESTKKKGTLEILWHLKDNLIFMMCICGLTCLYFIITNIQFWVTLYLINILGAT